MKKSNNVDLSLNTNKEEVKMNTFNGEIKDLETGRIERASVIDKGLTYLVEPYVLERDMEGSVSYRYHPSYTLDKELEGFEYAIYTEEEEAKMNEQIEIEDVLSDYFGEEVRLENEEEEEMEIMEKEIKTTEEEEVVRELNRLQEERESWGEELLENPFSDNNIKKRRESGHKLVLDSKAKEYQERLEIKKEERKETKKARPARNNVPYLNSWERANRQMQSTHEYKYFLLNRGWL